jgi:hypothetical protein
MASGSASHVGRGSVHLQKPFAQSSVYNLGAMFHDYQDITSRIADPPKWWDERGVPRYNDFNPRQIADVYSQEAALVEIACATCQRRLQVSVSTIDDDPLARCGTPLGDRIRKGDLSYGEPPAHGECSSGTWTPAVELRVLEYWIRGHNSGAWGGDWKRDSALEVSLPGLALPKDH